MEWMLMPYKRYADFNGRSRRMEYWMYALLQAIVVVVLGLLAFAGGSPMDDAGNFNGSPMLYLALGLGAIFFLASFVPSIAIVVRRLHDRDMSGWWYLGLMVAGMIPLVGFIASIALFVLMALPGTPGPNRFGADPLDPANAGVFS